MIFNFCKACALTNTKNNIVVAEKKNGFKLL